MFIRYKNLRGNSNVECYRIRASAIDVKFYNTNKIYTYSYAGPAGKRNVDNMKLLAVRGYGLNSYVNRFCRKLYD